MDELGKLIKGLLEDIREPEVKKIKRKINKTNIKASINLEKSDIKYYLSRLRISYTGYIPNQIRSWNIKLYNKFSKEIDKNFELDYQMTNIYDQVYALARAYVEAPFDRDSEVQISTINHNLSRFMSDIEISKLKDLADEFIGGLPPADEMTKEFYNLNERGLKKVFWDEEGIFREKYKFDFSQEKALNEISERKNVLWDNEKIKNLTLDIYLKTLKEAFNKDDLDTSLLISYTSPYTLSKSLLEALLVFTEANVRKCFSFLVDIKTDKAYQVIKDNSCLDILDFCLIYQKNIFDKFDYKLIEDIYMDYFLENPSKTVDIVNFIEKFDISYQKILLEDFRKSKYYKEILNKLLKEDFKITRIMALYYLYRDKLASPKNQRDLFKVIKEDNFDIFIDLINKEEFSIDLVKKILDLDKAQIKKISLDEEKIKKSRQDLNATVEVISDFIGDDEKELLANDIGDEENLENQKTEIASKVPSLSKISLDFLRKILAHGYISTDEASSIAMENSLFLNVFINNINDELFEYTNDQTLVIDGDRIYIDKFYVEMIKELIDE